MRNSPPRSKNNSGVTFLWALRLPSWFSASPYLQTGPFGDVLAPHFWPPSSAMRRHRLRLLDALADQRLHLFRSLDHLRDASPHNGLTNLCSFRTSCTSGTTLSLLHQQRKCYRGALGTSSLWGSTWALLPVRPWQHQLAQRLRLVGKLSPRSTQCTPLHRSSI